MKILLLKILKTSPKCNFRTFFHNWAFEKSIYPSRQIDRTTDKKMPSIFLNLISALHKNLRKSKVGRVGEIIWIVLKKYFDTKKKTENTAKLYDQQKNDLSLL